MNNSTCPHCGCSKYNDEIYWCSTLIADPSKAYERRSIFCSKLFELKEQLAAQAAEIERLRQAVLDEREACAAECRNWWKAEDCEKAIMARDNQSKGQHNDK